MKPFPMWRLAFYAMLIHYTSNFSFFYPEVDIKTNYKLKQFLIVKIKFDVTEKITKTAKFFDDTWDTLRKPYDVTYEGVMESQDIVNVQIADFFMLSSKMGDASLKYTELFKTLPEIPKEITYDKNITIAIDKSFLSQKLKNIKLTAAQVEIKMKTKTLEELKTDKQELATFLSTFENLNSDSETLISQITSLFTTIILTHQKIKTEHLSSYLSQIQEDNSIQDIDFEFINFYKENKKPIALIKINYLKNPLQYNELIPIPYNFKSLEHNYIFNHKSQKIEKLFTPEQIASGETYTDSECLNNLNKNFVDNTLASTVIDSCLFIDNYKTFHITEKGIFLFNLSTKNIKTLNAKLDLELKTSDQPVCISFNDSIIMETDLFGEFNVTKNDLQFVNYTSLTPNEIYLIQQIEITTLFIDDNTNTTLSPPFNIDDVDDFIIQNYPLLIASTTTTTSFFIIILTIFALIIKCKATPSKSLQKMFQKRAKKRKTKSKRAYSITHL